jgi:hypothetical protein
MAKGGKRFLSKHDGVWTHAFELLNYEFIIERVMRKN